MNDYWTENNIEKPQSIIVCAALRQGKIIVVGARHFDMLMQQQLGRIPSYLINTAKWEQGFVDQFGDFYNRVDALVIVKLSGQPYNEERNGLDSELFSEGLY